MHSFYDPSPAQTSEAAGHVIINPIDFDEVSDVNIYRIRLRIVNFPKSWDMVNFLANRSRDSNSANATQKIKRLVNRKLTHRAQNLLYSHKAIRKLKSDGEIKIRVPIYDWGETKWRSKHIATREIC